MSESDFKDIIGLMVIILSMVIGVGLFFCFCSLYWYLSREDKKQTLAVLWPKAHRPSLFASLWRTAIDTCVVLLMAGVITEGLSTGRELSILLGVGTIACVVLAKWILYIRQGRMRQS